MDEDEIRRMETIMLNPRQYKIPDWFLNRQKDCKDGTYSQTISNGLDTKLREDLERMKKVNNSETSSARLSNDLKKHFTENLRKYREFALSPLIFIDEF